MNQIITMFPLSVSGILKCSAGDKKAISISSVRDEIASGLTMEDALDVTKNNNEVSFSVGLFRPFWSWKMLIGVSDGRITIYEDPIMINISYRLRFLNLVIWVTCIILATAALDRLFSPHSVSFLGFLLVWFLLVVFNALIANFKFRRFLRQCVADATSHSYYWGRNKKAHERQAKK